MFDGLLKPKWQNPDPLQRKAALESSSVPPDVLATIAREDNDADVRACAIQRLDDLDLLAALLDSGQDRDVVVQRQCELLARPLDTPPSLDLRLSLLNQSGSADLCACLALRASAVEVRSAALEQVSDTTVLCKVAVVDAVASVRQMALDRIEDPDGWEIVSRDARNRDKQISRSAREKLDAYRQTIADQDAAHRLCDEMEALMESEHLTNHSPALFQRLNKQWQDIGSPLPPTLSERFTLAQQKLGERIGDFETQIRDRRAICTEMEALLEHQSQPQTDTDDAADELSQQLNNFHQRWQATRPEQNSDNPVTQHFNELQMQLRAASERLQRDRQRSARQRELIAQAAELLKHAEELDENRLKKLQQGWQKLDAPESTGLANALQSEFDNTVRRMRDVFKKRLDQRKAALQEAEKLLPDMQQALQDGELERALSMRDRINHRLKLAKGLDKQHHSALQKQLNQMRPQIDELRQWRHWGSDHAREHLLTEIEALTGSSLSADEVAARVRSARKAWQRIDHAEGPAKDELWQRFDNACTSAYAPYQQQRKQQKDVMNQHLAEKQKLCAELDKFEQTTDWGSVDLREVDQYVHKARERWRRIGFVARKQSKALEKDFHAVLERLDSHLAPERNRELQRRKALIARVDELSRASDLRSASREVKDAQNQWKPKVTLPRKDEQALWKQFRQACDAVFDRLRQERNSADQERRSNLQRRQAICEQLEALLDQPDTSYRDIQALFGATSEEWSNIRNIPRKHERSIEDRYAAIRSRIAELQRREAKSAMDARLNAMRERARLCSRLEYAVLDETGDEAALQAQLEQSEQEWQALPAIEPGKLKPLQSRYDLARQAVRGEGNARSSLRDALADNLQQRLQLCLQLEVAAGVESPAEYANERMKYQVSLLADSLQHIHPDQTPEQRITELETAWLLAGPIEQTEREQLEQRFERALAAAR